MENALFAYDAELLSQGFAPLCGVDEAGRGPLAGPVVAAAVILAPGAEEQLPQLNDSKKLSPKKRELYYDKILSCALSYGIGSASCQEIDQLNILQATFLAMRRAVAALDLEPALVLVDGNQDPGLELPTRTLIKGDGTSAAVAAASILAKVTRDRLLLQLDQDYPQYGFAQHKGYGTKAHYAALERYGLCPEHRRSFLKNLEKHHG